MILLKGNEVAKESQARGKGPLSEDFKRLTGWCLVTFL